MTVIVSVIDMTFISFMDIDCCWCLIVKFICWVESVTLRVRWFWVSIVGCFWWINCVIVLLREVIALGCLFTVHVAVLMIVVIFIVT